MAPLTLASSSANLSVKVQPTVLLNICDSYVRRSENQERVIGTLLGTIEGTTVEIKDCYAVPFNENQEQVGSQGSIVSSSCRKVAHTLLLLFVETQCHRGCYVQVAMDINHHQSLLSLHRKVSQQEVVVGW